MRERHRPRVCSHCEAPIARQESTCWRCGTEWASAGEPPTALYLVPEIEDAEVTAPLPATAARS